MDSRPYRRALRVGLAVAWRSFSPAKSFSECEVSGTHQPHPWQPACLKMPSSVWDVPWSPGTCQRISRMSTMSNSYFNQNVKVPMELPQRKKKPFLTTLKEFKMKKKATGDEWLRPPGNGLLVPELVPVALNTLKARATLLSGVHRLLKVFPIKACRFCPAVHVGPVGHRIASCLGPHNGVRHGRHEWINGRMEDVLPSMDAFHLSDRLAKAITHEERDKIPKVPAVVELCIQAGVDVAGYPTKRRTKPIIMIDSKMIEFDELDEDDRKVVCKHKIAGAKKFDEKLLLMEESSFDDLKEIALETETDAALAERTLQAWFAVRSGVKKLMSKYLVQVCGYCPQVHVGPKGTKTCDCKAYKHHQRYGHHGWQEAFIDDLIPPRYVWHLRDRNSLPLETELRVFYGAAPAIVELCMQAGAAIPEEYKPMMRLDVVIPDMSELDMVA